VSDQTERLVNALVTGQLTMCQAPGCGRTFPPGVGRSNRRYCGEPDCPRNRRTPRVTAAHRSQAVRDLRADLAELEGPALQLVQESISGLNRALKDGAISDEDVRVEAVQLAAAACNVAAVVDALGRGGLSSQGTPRPALAERGSSPAPRSLPQRTGAQDEAASAMLNAAS
jgi:hypothetical protein